MIEAGGILGALVAMLAGPYYGIQVQKQLHQMLIAARSRAADIAEAKQILGLEDMDCLYRSDNTHSLYPKSNTLHPDNFDALGTLTQYRVIRARDQNNLIITNSVEGDFERSLVLVGSPTAEGCSRIVFGYVPRPNDPDSLILGDAPVDLPYYWVLDKQNVEATAARVVAGMGVRYRPNWRIQGSIGVGRLYIPNVDESGGGLLHDDYLLVTRVRNYLSAGALQSGKTIMTFGGTHGVGTKAIELLFRDHKLLSQLGSKLKGTTAYQALFRVGNIQHGAFGSRASTIELVDVKILPDSDHVWRIAQEKARPRLEQWLQSAPPKKRRPKK